jgi:uncharacterized protein YndB with AHSA1/START domain
MQRIIHVLNINADQDNVFEAIATAEGLSQWWSTNVKAEEKVGGIVDFTFIPEFNPSMKITMLDRPSQIRWECVSGHDLWHDNTFSFVLTESKGVTQLTFTQEYAREISDEEYGIYNYNWAYYLQSLKGYCESGKGKPHVA